MMAIHAPSGERLGAAALRRLRSGWASARRLLAGQAGQGMVEYAFILILIALVVLVMLITTGGQVRNMYSDITTALKNPAGL